MAIDRVQIVTDSLYVFNNRGFWSSKAWFPFNKSLWHSGAGSRLLLAISPFCLSRLTEGQFGSPELPESLRAVSGGHNKTCGCRNAALRIFGSTERRIDGVLVEASLQTRSECVGAESTMMFRHSQSPRNRSLRRYAATAMDAQVPA
jgi:hypothetical protein